MKLSSRNSILSEQYNKSLVGRKALRVLLSHLMLSCLSRFEGEKLKGSDEKLVKQKNSNKKDLRDNIIVTTFV